MKLAYLGKQALNTGIGIAQDAVAGDNILASTKRRIKRTAQDMAGDAAERANKFAQTGEGRKRRRRRRKPKQKKKAVASKRKRSGKVKRRKSAKTTKRRKKKRSFLLDGLN